MSDIPKAKSILQAMLRWELEDHVRDEIDLALKYMTRKAPAFVAPRTIPPLSETDKEHARILRKQGYAMNDIARKLKTNLGRISEACAS